MQSESLKASERESVRHSHKGSEGGSVHHQSQKMSMNQVEDDVRVEEYDVNNDGFQTNRGIVQETQVAPVYQTETTLVSLKRKDAGYILETLAEEKRRIRSEKRRI